MTAGDVRPLGFFSTSYTVIAPETIRLFGSQHGVGSMEKGAPQVASPSTKTAPAPGTNSTAPGVTDYSESRLMCSQHPDRPPPYTKHERESGPRSEIRRFSFCYRHKRDAIHDSAAFSKACLDAAFPQLKLWQSLCDAMRGDDSRQFSLQAVRDVWVEVEESASAPSTPLIPSLSPDKNQPPLSWAQRNARKQLGLDDDDDDDLMFKMTETRVHAYVVLDPLLKYVSLREAHALKLDERSASTRGASAASHDKSAPHHEKRRHSSQHLTDSVRSTNLEEQNDGADALPYAWSTKEVNMLLLRLSQFAKLSTQFTRKGTRRRSGKEPTIMLDMDEDHVFVSLTDPRTQEEDKVPRIEEIVASIDCVSTCCKLRDNRYVQSPSIILIQYDFDASMWRGVTFPTAAPLTGAGADSAQSGAAGQTQSAADGDVAPPSKLGKPPSDCDGAEGVVDSLTGVKTTMFLLGLLLLRLAKRESFDVRAVRHQPGCTKPEFLLGKNNKLRHDATFRAVLLQLIDVEACNRPGPSQVLEALRAEGGGTFRSRHAAPAPMSGALPPSRGSETGSSPTREEGSRKGPALQPSPPSSSQGKKNTSCTSPPRAAGELRDMYEDIPRKKIEELLCAAKMQTSRVMHQPRSPTACKDTTHTFLASCIPAAAAETQYERQQRFRIRQHLNRVKADPTSSLTTVRQRDRDDPSLWFGGSVGSLSTHGTSTAGAASGRPASRDGQRTSHDWDDSSPSGTATTRRTAETPANDVRPSPRRRDNTDPMSPSKTTTSIVPIAAVFEL